MKKRIIQVLAVMAAVAITAIVGFLMVRFVSESGSFERWSEQHAVLGRLVYVIMVLFQVVVAVIPGEPLEIAGGFAFGAVEGTLLCMAGAMTGSVIVFALVRKYGMRVVEIFFTRDKLKAVRFLKNDKKRDFLLALIFILPGTPKDLLCYFAPLTDIKWPLWLAICSLGRFPSIVTSTVGGSALETENYWSAVAVFAVTLMVSLGGVWLYHRICDRHRKSGLAHREERADVENKL